MHVSFEVLYYFFINSYAPFTVSISQDLQILFSFLSAHGFMILRVCSYFITLDTLSLNL